YCDVPEDTVVIDIGARSTHLLFAGAGRFMVRTLTLAGNTITQVVADSLKLSFIEAEALKRQVMGGYAALAEGDAGGAAVAEAAELFCQRLQVEVARSLLGYGRQVPGFLPVKVLLTGGGAGVPELSMTLAEKMKLPVKPYDALRGVELCEGARANGAVAAVRYLPILVGLAAQRSLAATRPLNLLPPALRQQVSFRRQQPWWLATAALLVITWLPPWWHFYELAKSATMETTRMESRIGPWRAREADNAAKLAQLAEVRRQMDGLRGLVASKSNWLELLADLQSSLAKVEDVWLDRLQIVAEPPARDRPDEEKRPLRLELNGRLLDVSNPVAKVSPDSYARVKTLLTSFGESRFVAAVEDERFDNRQPGILQFDCTLVMNPENPL
ncbi:MAG: pilus assembly protein PilM, partial [Opitutaceae bacterium]|nr:pilus assembly protein PilM [Opitutaceae bacterium]